MRRRILLTTAAVALSVGAVPVAAQMPGLDDPRARQRIQQPQPQQPTQGPATQPQALDRQPAQRGLQTQQPEQPAQRNLQTQQPEAQPPRGVRPAQPSATHGQRPQTPAQPGQARQPTGQPPAAQTPQRPGTEPAQRPAQAQQPPAQAQRPPNVPSSGVVTLNNQQRIQIAQSIQRQNVQPLRSVNFSLAVGVTVPRSVQLYPLSADLVTVLPQFRGYSFFVVEERIVIVEPGSLQIVAIVPYAVRQAIRTTARAQAAAPLAAEPRPSLSARQRATIRSYAVRQAVPERVIVEENVIVGETVPEWVELYRFPETVYHEIPAVRGYRYFRDDEGLVLVDPGPSRRVIEVIR